MIINKSKRENISNNANIEEFEHIIQDLVENSTVQEMENYKQHYSTTCFEHCRNVAYYSYLICKKYNLDYISAARGGMLHDLFLYNWRKQQRNIELNGLHAFVHPKIALINSLKLFNLNDIEKDIILKHMWPLTLKFPKYKESFIITFVDKFCAIKEFVDYIKGKDKFAFIYRYSYVLFAILVLNI